MPRRARGPATLENTQTGDGRVFAPGAIEWADLPLPLAWIRDGDQHVNATGAPQIGTIDELTRDGDAIMGVYTIDDNDPDLGGEVVRRMEAGTAPLGNRFPISIDPDNWDVEIVATDAAEEEIVLLAAPGGRGPITRGAVIAALTSAIRAAAGDPDPGENGGEDGTVLFEDTVDAILERYTRLRIRGATLCAVAAFDGAWIELDAAEGESETPAETSDDDEAIAAAAVPVRPPRAWFEMTYPEAGDDRLVEQPGGGWAIPLTITEEGQVFGHIARADQAHRGLTPRHVPPPTSSIGYREFHTGTVVCDDDTQVAVGPLVVGCDHAPLSMTLGGARDHYAHSGLGWADVRCQDGPFGPFVSGALRPGLTDEDLRVIRALAPSGDWRATGRDGELELIAVLSVNAPGFPVAREAMAASALAAAVPATPVPQVNVEDGHVTALVAAGIVHGCPECAERARREAEALEARLVAGASGAVPEVMSLLRTLRSEVARIDRRTRHLEAGEIEALRARVHRNG